MAPKKDVVETAAAVETPVVEAPATAPETTAETSAESDTASEK
jgi:hypothetical protein